MAQTFPASIDIGLTGAAGSSTRTAGSDALHLDGAGEEGVAENTTADALHFAYTTLTGDGQVVVRLQGFQGKVPAGARAGLMIRSDLSAAAAHASVLLNSAQGAAYVSRTVPGAVSTSVSASTVAAPQWLKLIRTGNEVTGLVSSDGVNWAFVGQEVPVLPATVYVGLATTSGTDALLVRAAFDQAQVTAGTVVSREAPGTPSALRLDASADSFAELSWEAAGDDVGIRSYGIYEGDALVGVVPGTQRSFVDGLLSPATAYRFSVKAFDLADHEGALSLDLGMTTAPATLPAPWLHNDVGNVGAGGTATWADPVFTIKGAGDGSGGTADAFHFTYQQITGDGELIARVQAVGDAGSAAVGGVMLRRSLDPDARSAAMVMHADRALTFQTRNVKGSAVNTVTADIVPVAFPYWIKIKRVGSVVFGYFSEDGSVWTLAGVDQVPLGAREAYIGLVVASGKDLVLARARFDSVSLRAEPIADFQAPAAPGAPTLIEAPGSDSVHLSWAGTADNVGVTAYQVLRDGTVIATVPALSYVDTGLNPNKSYAYSLRAVDNAGNLSPAGPAVAAATSLPEAKPRAAATAKVGPVTNAVPSAPTGLAAAPGNAQVSLTWTAVSGATSYSIKRATTTGGAYTSIKTGQTTASYVNTGLTNGTKYFYVVSSTNSSGEGANSSEVSATPVAPPAAPTGLAATPGNAQVALTWTAISGATSYSIKRATVSGGPYTAVKVGQASANYTDTGLTNGTIYYYVVTATNAGGEGASSTQVSAAPVAPPTVPTGLAATPGNAQVSLSWTAVSGATSYTVSRATVSGGPYTAVKTALATATYTDTGLTNGTLYYYVVNAANAGGSSANCAQVSATPVAPPAAPTGLTATPGNAQVSFTWTAVSGATSYSIKRATVNGGPYTVVKAGQTTVSYTDTGLTNGTLYYYVVSASKAGSESANSTQVSATPVAPPSVPAGLTATAGNAQVVLNWSAVAGATSYSLGRATVSGGPYTTIKTGLTAASYTDPGLTNGTAYYYVVTASNPGGTSANSAQASATPLAPAATPTGLAASPGNAQATISWVAVTGATSYTVKRGAASAGPFTAVQSGVTTTSYTNTGLTNGTVYYFVVDAVNAGGTSADSAAVSVTPTAPPPAPATLTATPGNAQVALNWGAVTGAATYTVKRATVSSGPYTNVQTGLASPTYTNTGLTNGTTYYFVVSATNAGGEGPNSAQVGATPVALPIAPAGLTATAGNAQAALNWGAVTGAATYTVKRATVSGGPYTNVQTGLTSSTYTNTGLSNGTIYYFVVSATNAAGEGPISAQIAVTPVAPPAVPATPAATAGNAQVTLTWPATAGATSYNVSSSTTAGGAYTLLQSGIMALTYTRTGLINGTTYYFVVSATNAGGTSANSAQTGATPLAPPSAPTGLSASPGNAQVGLSWGAVAGAASYSVKRGTASAGPFTLVKSGLAATTYTDTGLTNGSLYYYVVSATNASGESANSASVGAAPVAAPAVPTGLGTTGGNAQVTLSWTSSAGATSYSVSLGTASAGPFSLDQSGLGGTTYTKTGLTNGTTYYFVVSATNAGGTSANSTAVSGMPAAPLVAPTALTEVSHSDVSATMTWTKVADNTGAVAYDIYRGGTNVGSTAATVTRFTDTALAPASSNTYTVRARDGSGRSSVDSTAVSIVTAAAGVPSPWQHQEVGSVGLAGSATLSAGVFTVKGAGTDIAGTSDHFHYLYQPLVGNGQIIARLASMDNTDTMAKAGVMIRSSLTGDSPYAAVCYTPSSGVLFTRRLTTTGTTTVTTTTGQAAPGWLKLTRNGSTVQGYWSTNGTTWTSLGSQSITMPTNVYVGFAVSSRIDATLCTAVFDSVTTVSGDSDNDSLPDAWEIQYFGNIAAQTGSGDPDMDGKTNFQEYQNGTDPTDYYNGQSFTLQAVSGGGQGVPPGGTGSLPLVVKAFNTTGTIAGNAPVTFTPSAGLVGAAAAGPFSASVTVRTSTSTGQASVYYQAPNVLGGSYNILAKMGTASGSGQASFQVFGNELPSTNMKFWLRADRGVVLDTAGMVSTWYDQSGLGNNATQTSSTVRPQLVNGAVGGKPGLYFDGISNWGGHNPFLNLPNCLSGLTQGAILAVVQPGAAAVPENQGLWTFNVPTYVICDRFGADYTNAGIPGNSQAVYDGTGNSAQLRADQDYVYYAVSQPSWFSERINDQLLSSSLVNTVGFPTTPRLGRTTGTTFYSNGYFTGHIAEVIVYSQPPAASDLQNAYAYLNSKYHFTTQLARPTNLQVTTGSLQNSARLSWDGYQPDKMATYYAVERQTNGGAFTQIALVSSQTSYLDTGLVAGQNYVYQVRAMELGTYSAYSTQTPFTSSANAPLVPLAGLQLWLRADAGVTSDFNGAVSAWYDQSGNNRHAQQFLPSLRPTLVPAAAGVPAVIRFLSKGDDDVSPATSGELDLPDFLSAQNAGEVFAVVRENSPVGTKTYFNGNIFQMGPYGTGYSAALGEFSSQYQTGETNNLESFDDNFGSSTGWQMPVMPSMHDRLHVYNASAGNQYWSNRLDGVTRFTSNTNAVAWSTTPTLGTQFTGDFGEVLVYDHVLSDADRQQVQLYLNAKYLAQNPPAAPAAPTLLALSPTQVHLGWKGVMNGVGYRIERKLSTDAAFQQLADLPDVLSYVDSTLPAGAQCQYRVRAYNLAGTSAYSDVLSATLPLQGQTVPLDSLAAWFKEDAGVITDAGAHVVTWEDQSSNGSTISRDGTRFATGQTPTLVPGQLNGEAVMHFDGATQSLHFSNQAAQGTQAEVFVVLQATQANPDHLQGFWQMSDYTGTTAYPDVDGSFSDTFGSQNIHAAGAPLKRIDQYRLYNAASQDSSWVCRLDGAEQYRTTDNTFALTQGANCYLGVSNSSYFAGDMAEMMVFNRALTDAERHAVENYLMTKYGLIDSDGDGMPDWWERKYFGDLSRDGTGDYDGDGLSDLAEYQHGTNPLLRDTDGDGMSDGFEVAHGLNPLKNDAHLDLDGDGIPNYLDAAPNDPNNGALQVIITTPANNSVVNP